MKKSNFREFTSQFWNKYHGYLVLHIIIFLLGVIFCLVGVGFIENEQAGTILVSVGSSIIAAAIIAFLDIVRLFKIEGTTANTRQVVQTGGIVNFFAHRDLTEYQDKVLYAKDSIDIVGYSLNGFYESNREILDEKCKKNYRFKIRILLVNPDSEFSKQRDQEEHFEASEAYRTSYNNLREWGKDNPSIEIRIINRQLSSMIYKIDDCMYIGPYLYKKSSKITYTLEIGKGTHIYEEHLEEFNKMWQEAKKI